MFRILGAATIIISLSSCAGDQHVKCYGSVLDTVLVRNIADTADQIDTPLQKLSVIQTYYGGNWPSVCRNSVLDAQFEGCRESEESWGVKIKDECWEGLDDDAKLYYCLSVRESFYQNCSFVSYDSAAYRKIPFRLPARMDGLCTSWRQTEFLKEHRNATITRLKECLNKECNVDIETKRTIEDLAAIELIPDLVKCYRTTEVRDLTILTLFIRFMEMSGYEPLYETGFYKTAMESSDPVYLEASDVDLLRNVSMEYSAEAEQEIIELAEAFYTELYGEH